MYVFLGLGSMGPKGPPLGSHRGLGWVHGAKGALGPKARSAWAPGPSVPSTLRVAAVD